MALKAGLVGVNPKGVDKNGMPIASGGSGVSEAQLTANGKQFFFAYDETSEKYGYKLDGAGDFIPFESAGGGPGWVKPADLTHEGLIFSSNCEYIEGGYYDDGTMVYIDVVYHKTSGSSGKIEGFPLMKNLYTMNFSRYALNNSPSDIDDYFINSTTADYCSLGLLSSTATDCALQDGSTSAYCRVIGQYAKKTS